MARPCGWPPPKQPNDVGSAVNAQGAPASDESPAAAHHCQEDDRASGDQSSSGAAAISAPMPSSGMGCISGLLWIIAAVSGAVAIVSIACSGLESDVQPTYGVV